MEAVDNDCLLSTDSGPGSRARVDFNASFPLTRAFCVGEGDSESESLRSSHCNATIVKLVLLQHTRLRFGHDPGKEHQQILGGIMLEFGRERDFAKIPRV